MDMPLPYAVPEIQDNPDGWGPCKEPEHLKDVPFAPFSKGDKLGKAADWTQQAYQKNFPGAFDPALHAFPPAHSMGSSRLDHLQHQNCCSASSSHGCACYDVQVATRLTQQMQSSSSSTTRRYAWAAADCLAAAAATAAAS